MSIINEIEDATDHLRGLLHDLREFDLVLNPLGMNEQDFAVARRALEVMQDPDVPLMDCYPDGTTARPPYSPKQALLLAKVPPITHEQEAYQHLVRGIQRFLGRQEKQRCLGVTKKGNPCRNWCLAYEYEDVFPIDRRCSSHAQTWQREHNSRMQEREEELIREGLGMLSDRMGVDRDPPTSKDAEEVLAMLAVDDTEQA